MPTPLIRTDLGPVSLMAPEVAPRHIVATYGHLWQWTGTGQDLYTLTVAVRKTRLGNLAGVRQHLQWEVDQLRPTLEAPGTPASATAFLTDVDGSSGATAADVVGKAHGADVLHRIHVSTDGEHMHVTRVVVPVSQPGRELLDRVTASLRVLSWSMPA